MSWQRYHTVWLIMGFGWIAPYLTGWMKDATGSFSGGLYMAGFLMGCGVILALAIRPFFRIKSGG